MRISCAFLVVLAAGLSAEQVNYSAAKSSGRLDLSGVTARDQAMGNAAVAAGQGPSVFLANPALLSGQGDAYSFDQNLNLFYSRSLLSASHGFGAFSGAASLGYADFGAVNGSNEDGLPFSVRPFQLSLDLGAGRPLESGFSAGLAAHSLMQSFGGFGTKTAFGATGGLGFAAKGWTLGIAQSLESDMDRSANTVLSSVNFGLAWTGAWLETQNVTLAGQVDYDYGFSRIARVGIENWSLGILALRVGYEAPLEQEYNPPAWTTGVGVQYGTWVIDFCYASRDVLGSTQRVTLTWRPKASNMSDTKAEAKAVEMAPAKPQVPLKSVKSGANE